MAMDLEVCMYICSVSTYEHTNIAHIYIQRACGIGACGSGARGSVARGVASVNSNSDSSSDSNIDSNTFTLHF